MSNQFFELGRLLAVLYEEGILQQLGFTDNNQAISSVIECPVQVFTKGIALHNQLQREQQLVCLEGDLPKSINELKGEKCQQFIEGYKSEIKRLIYVRWYGFLCQFDTVQLS